MPVDLGRLRAAGDREHVEAAGVPREVGTGLQEQPGGSDEACALARGHRVERSAEAAGAAVAHLDEDDGRAVAHDEVELAVAVVHVARDEREAVSLRMREGEVLERGAGRAHARQGTMVGASAPCAGRATPPEKRAHDSTRWMRPKLSAAS